MSSSSTLDWDADRHGSSCCISWCQIQLILRCVPLPSALLDSSPPNGRCP
jgi:hypothetical protein